MTSSCGIVTRHSCKTVKPPTPESKTPIGRRSIARDGSAAAVRPSDRLSLASRLPFPFVRRLLALSAAIAALAPLGFDALAAPGSDPGVTPTEILIGGTVPLTGEAAAFGSVGPGAKAYFDYVNAHGGVYGRKIVYRYYDDGYDPSRTVQLTRQLVEQDKVFAIFNSVGTAENIAIRDYLNAMK